MNKYLKHLMILFFSTAVATANAGTIQPFFDLLAWRASESDSDWATTFTFQDKLTNVTESAIDFNTKPGFKLGINYLSDNNFLDSTVYWTHYSTNKTDNHALNAQILTSLFFSGSYFISNDLYFGGNANWKLIMNMLDVQVSHPFKPIPSLQLIPKLGIKGGTINQTINITWDALLYKSTENITNDFTGIGPSFGLTGKWNFYNEWSVIGDITTALMYGRWNDTDTYQRPSALFGLITPTTISTNMTQTKYGSLMMDYYLGLEWHHKTKTDITLRLGYEAQYWANQLRLVAVQQLPTSGDLTFQGLTCGISIGF